jgi:hypothetical protein
MASERAVFTLEGQIDFPERTARVVTYTVDVASLGAIYNLVENLPGDFGIVFVRVYVKEAFDGTLELGDESNHAKYINNANFRHTVGRKFYVMADLGSRGADKGQSIKLYVGPGTSGKLIVNVSGTLLFDNPLMGL